MAHAHPNAASSVRVCETCGGSDWGTRNRCKPCRATKARADWANNLTDARAKDSARHRAWRAAHPEKARAQKRRQRYAINTPELDALLVAQGGRCPICAVASPDCVDHCHKTGRVRGVLCRACNIGLGCFRDDPRRLRAAARYLA
jgi:hypothetical protein